MGAVAPGAAAGAVEGISPARSRDRRAVWAALASLVSRTISYAVVLLSVPLTLGYLGQDRYGVWVALSGTVSWILALDFGLGSTLRQRLGAAAALGDRPRAQAEVSTIFALLCGLTLILTIALAAAVPLVRWSTAFNAGAAASEGELRWAVAIIAALMLVRLPLLVVGAVHQAYQRGWIPAAWDAIASVTGLGALLLVTQRQWGLAALAASITGAAVLGSILGAFHLFFRSEVWLRPRLAHIRRASIGAILRLGGSFLILQVAAVVLHQTDTIVVAHVLGPEAVATFDVAYRPFWILLSIHGVCLAPLVAAYAEAFVTGDLVWIRSRLALTAGGSLATAGFAGALLVAHGETLLSSWVGAAVSVDRQLLVALASWMVLYVWTSCFAGFLIGIGAVSLMGWIAILSAPVNILLCITLAKEIGLPGVAIGNIATLLIGSIAATIEVLVRLRRAEARA